MSRARSSPRPPVRRCVCRVEGLEAATRDIRIVRLRVVSGGPFRFRAGQYARVTFGGYPPRDYSMANRPDEEPLEFHVRHAGGHGVSAFVAHGLRRGDRVLVEGPFGAAWLRRSHRGPMLAVAGGSGLAPIKSIVETALAQGRTRPIHLYFAGREDSDIYLEPRFRALARAHPNLRFVPVLSEPRAATNRRVGSLDEVVAADLPDLTGFKAYLAGSPEMVEVVVAKLARLGLPARDIHADPFYSMAEAAARAKARKGRRTAGSRRSNRGR